MNKGGVNLDVETLGIGIALILAIWAYVGIVINLSPGISWQEPLVAGTITGIIVGDVSVGLYVGGTLTLMSLGMHTYGGTSIPDFQVGAILGTAFGVSTGSIETGLTIAVAAAMLMIQLDVFGRAVTTGFIHAADKHVEKGNFRGMTMMHLLGHIPWGLTRAIPVFLAIWLGEGAVTSFMEWMPEWFMNGMRTTGAILPALGFALLLAQLPVKKYLPFLAIGFVLFAYLGVPVIGIAIAATALAALFMQVKGGTENA
ncbi:MAG: PTS sugar transporter subunit IIC [Firmicutes bacterium]|nr:PTS sugar transporter subunit IIC [Bacillota bacterium]